MSKFEKKPSIYYKDLNVSAKIKNTVVKKDKKTDEVIKESFDDSKIKAKDSQYKSNLNKELYMKVKSNNIKEEDYLKIEDFPEPDLEFVQLYSQITYDIKESLDIFNNEIKNININVNEYDNISKGRPIEEMVEETYSYRKGQKEEMLEEICCFKKLFKLWRPVLGDGNCFYRSVIFCWLEYIIFNRKIVILKMFMVNLYKKFDITYYRNNEFPEDLKEQYFTDEKYVALPFLQLIIEHIEKNNIKEAYLILLKAFNNTIFDRIMIFYLRYLIYEYIEKNQEKLLSKEFPVLLGNLLPNDYETEDGKFLYKKYFYEHLLKYKDYAEKLPIYLIPYILKVNLNLVYYNFSNESFIRNKIFPCNLPNKDQKKDTISVLYRLIHYDICYTKEYYNTFKEYLELYCNSIADLKNIDSNDIIQKEKIFSYNPQGSLIFSRKKVKKPSYNENNNKKIKELTSNIITYGITNKNRSLEKCFICDKYIENYEQNNEILPCKCFISFCTDECKENYYKCLVLLFNSMKIDINLKCGICGKDITRITILDNLDNFILKKDVKNALKNKMFEFFNNNCCNCLKTINSNIKYNKKKCKGDLTKLLDTKKFEHKMCEECCKEKNNVELCKICNIYHSTLVE